MFLTDPERTPHPWEQAERLPRGAGVVLRWFGRDDRLEVGRRLAEVCRDRGLRFLVGADADLAEAVEADGLHVPERNLEDVPSYRRRYPEWMITAAAHSPEAVSAATFIGLDAVLVSPVFTSSSPSAGAPLGVETFKAWVAGAGIAVYALGGVTADTAPALAGSGACGLATIGGI